MWRSSKRIVVGCIQLIMRCGRNNLNVDDVDDMSEYDVHDVPGNSMNYFLIALIKFIRKGDTDNEKDFNHFEYKLISM